jgi:hypothetical protein
MKIIITLLLILYTSIVFSQYNPTDHTLSNKAIGFAQDVPTDARSKYFVKYNNLFRYRVYQSTAEVLSYLSLPKYRGGQFPVFVNVGGTLQADSLTFVGGNTVEYWFKNGTTNGNLVMKTVQSRDTFPSNFQVKGVTAYLKWANGDSVPAKGKTAAELLLLGAVKSVPYVYTYPTTSISGSPSPGYYEIGTNIGTITLSSSLVNPASDAGAATSTLYSRNGSSFGVGINTDAISSITTTANYQGVITYAQGPLRYDNLGDPASPIRLPASSTAASNTLSYIPTPKYYFGVTATSTPTDAEVRAAAQQGFSFAKGQSNVTIPAAGQYVFYAYPSALGDLTRIFNTLGDFTIDDAGWKKIYKTSFSNAQSYTVPLVVYTLQVLQGGPVTSLTFQ